MYVRTPFPLSGVSESYCGTGALVFAFWEEDLITYILLCAVYEDNKAGSIPYVPLLKAPYYIWLGKAKQNLAINGN